MLFSYRAKNFKGEEISGELDADSERSLATRLGKDGYVLLEVKAVSGGRKGKADIKQFLLGGLSSVLLFRRVKLVDKMAFSRNLAVMIKAGLPIARALEALSREAANAYFRMVIESVVDQVRKGKTLKESFGAHGKVFSPLYVAMVEAGEKSGKLDESLNILALQMRSDHEIIKRVRGAMIYPAIVLAVMVIIGIAMLVYVVPVLVGTFDELGVELPRTTKTIITISSFILAHWVKLLFALPVLLFLAVTLIKTRRGKKTIDLITVNLPIVGSINHQFNTARTARMLGSLLASGVAVSDALEITSRVLQNHYYSDILLEARESIQKGATMSSVFSKHPRLFSSLLNEMVSVGEETGEMTSLLEEVAVFYEGEVDASTKDLSKVIEPLLMVVIGATVGFFAVSMIQPLYSVLGTL
ncbi:MAG: hypothetical protein A3C80_03135 [Candidatus Ryanbacteria bacterium RIFCSPHIGHO2_02_FULL_45_43]|uniref:Type II secretion system protein GspF domain-containing protein n=1 Tax=Candidatus Ryanbacteria bacterium RIFCSPHIGHO2_01_45_13 TaxID=1802112 RepID=A0A1G2FZA5_9BACT|nr:MAG: hypothetical protein A2718_04090 [Candidatus Ryanbacteria bacterium RIFCSPHIGHO2_01_FULL_44_130]OGZ43399.1 MAG: hypothetical protein A2W41_04005 [Candidatus Ryanbacteria bacterium RIFCSPHIGHO2_01_45_13]OGZ48968.1 MAG: hypothetical protein A3C80_03135 [Candidatus Ryanbacteria bacterium RIFCSPHIGHO2_02_FULL_45_43]OGZ50969.1 MAG: hypothetical protein A3E55_04405 [Candidatus Ryanbacteria bacterium RIFCSPHIGHO2_12_FULL_44_20]OGZ51574.1 MAG: hypothetical protein A3A17_02070 [Candidatus Ryanba